MARLCVLMSLFVFGVSFAPVVLTQASEDKPAEKGSDTTAEVCATFKKCAEVCKATAKEIKAKRGDKDDVCADTCEMCHHMCMVCANLVKAKHTSCDDAKKLCSTILADCVKECEKSDLDCCKKCVKACQACLEACKAGKTTAGE